MARALFLFLVLLYLPASLVSCARQPDQWTGDFDKLVEHRIIRALVPYSRTYYFFDRGKPKGLTYETLVEFEKKINADLKNRHLKVHVMVIPTPRDKLVINLTRGLGDIAAGNLTITDQRRAMVDFSRPLLTHVRELPVTGPESPPITHLEDLAGKTIHVRLSSSYFESLTRLNQRFKSKRITPVQIIRADESLEDEDLLDMVNAGIIPMVVVDSHKALFWKQILENIQVHTDVAIRKNGEIAWAVRKNSPQLMEKINQFVKTNKKGTLRGNILFERYLKRTAHIKNPGTSNQFARASKSFKTYGKMYDIDWLILKALAFQESGINQKTKSHKGAVGVMQILPSTARDPNVNIPEIHKLDGNIHAGAKYLRFLMDRYFSSSRISDRDKILLGLAAYNAGPRKVALLQKEAEAEGLNPHVWFKNLEVAAARKIGRETVQYVNNIFKYYIAYKRIQTLEDKKREASTPEPDA